MQEVLCGCGCLKFVLVVREVCAEQLSVSEEPGLPGRQGLNGGNSSAGVSLAAQSIRIP